MTPRYARRSAEGQAALHMQKSSVWPAPLMASGFLLRVAEGIALALASQACCQKNAFVLFLETVLSPSSRDKRRDCSFIAPYLLPHE